MRQSLCYTIFYLVFKETRFPLLENTDTHIYLLNSGKIISMDKNTHLQMAVLDSSFHSIPERLFFSYSNLRSVVLPNNIQVIGGYSFFNCEKLK